MVALCATDAKVVKQMAKKFGSIIKRARLEKDLSLRALAELAGIDFSYISRLEKGSHTPSRDTVIKIAKALDIPVNELMIAAGYMPDDMPTAKEENYADIGPVGFMGRGDIDIKELERIINRAVKKALAERERERQRNGEDS